MRAGALGAMDKERMDAPEVGEAPQQISVGAKTAYKKVNDLARQLREFQLKYDNQNVLLRQTEEELR